jgi:hypothetical protein
MCGSDGENHISSRVERHKERSFGVSWLAMRTGSGVFVWIKGRGSRDGVVEFLYISLQYPHLNDDSTFLLGQTWLIHKSFA